MSSFGMIFVPGRLSYLVMLPDVIKPCVLSCLQLGLQVTLSATEN